MAAKITFMRLANQFIKDNPSLRVGIDSALKEISELPHVDGKTKFYYSVPPAVISLYKKDNLWVLYRLNEDCTEISIWSIGKQGDKVTFR